ncbi:hypothetical protein ATC03_10925 [Agromyces aureus]|uniref:HTH luxR-type domain-containing protein n=1 Tax=Agromyces aureus TaxID=453304 RepID=A0A191WFX7_9MICO|nr:hypothetical protein ATC03_10925 [Agromyces aureus]
MSTAIGMEVGDPPDQIMLTMSLVQWLRQLATERPVVIVFDDLQWTDRATARILSMVTRRLEGLSVAAIFSRRTGEDSSLDGERVVELQLAPLSMSESEALLREHTPYLHPSVRRRIHELSAGNPLALVELPRGLTPEQEIGTEMLTESIPLTERLRRLFASRVEVLPPAARELLLMAALDGIDEAAFAPLIAEAERELVEAESSGLVRVSSDGRVLRFRHPLTRAAIVEMASAPQRRAAHERLAELSNDPYLRAIHRAESLIGFDDGAALDLDSSAVRALERGDVIQAITVTVRAAELTSDPAHRARRLAEAAYLGSHITGRLVGAQAMLQRARLSNPDAASTLQSAVAAASHLANSEGGVDSAHRMLVAALESTPVDELDPRAVEAAVTTMLFVCAFGGRHELWESFDQVARRYSADLPRALALSASTFADPARSTPSELSELDRIVELTEEDTNPARVLQVAIAGHYVNRLPKRAVERVVDAARAGGPVAAGATCLILLAADAFFEGRWDDAERLADESIALCEEHGLKAIQWGGMNPRMLVAAGRGDTAFLIEAHERMRTWAVPRRARAVTTFIANVDGLLALGEGRSGDAYNEYLKIARPGTFPPHEQVTMWTMMDVVEACVGSGRLEEARRHVQAVDDLNLAATSPRLRFLRDAAAAYVAPDETYEHAFETVLAAQQASLWPFHLARVELAYGDRLRHHREMRRARPHLARAAGIFGALGAAPWEDRANSALQATGQTRRQLYAQGAMELTPQEAEVAKLAASGLSNKQIGERLFLSARTVSGHLYRVFPKLGISSRAALRDALTELRSAATHANETPSAEDPRGALVRSDQW